MYFKLAIALSIAAELVSFLPSNTFLNIITKIMSIGGLILFVTDIVKRKPNKKDSLKSSLIIFIIAIILMIVSFISSYFFYDEYFKLKTILMMSIPRFILNKYTLMAFVYLIYGLNNEPKSIQNNNMTQENITPPKRKKTTIWYILLVLGLIPWIIFLYIVISSAFIGFGFMFSTSYGIDAMFSAFLVIGALASPILAIGVALIILSIVFIKKIKKENKANGFN